MAREVAACTRCAELARTRTQTVFGVGNPYARLVFCGEAPGADEDRLGEPFVGRAGQLLTDIIVKGMKMRREDVYILNILRCRPPGNRDPLPVEAANCREYLDRQLAIIQPEFICCLGAVAAQNLLGTDDADRPAPRPDSRLPRHQGRLHLPPRLSAAESGGQASRLGRHPDADGGDGEKGDSPHLCAAPLGRSGKWGLSLLPFPRSRKKPQCVMTSWTNSASDAASIFFMSLRPAVLDACGCSSRVRRQSPCSSSLRGSS